MPATNKVEMQRTVSERIANGYAGAVVRWNANDASVPINWRKPSACMETPVARTGWPLAFSPLDRLTGGLPREKPCHHRLPGGLGIWARLLSKSMTPSRKRDSCVSRAFCCPQQFVLSRVRHRLYSDALGRGCCLRNAATCSTTSPGAESGKKCPPWTAWEYMVVQRSAQVAGKS